MMEKVFTPIMWDSHKNEFFPVKCVAGSTYPMLEKKECKRVCKEMNQVIISDWKPKKGEKYWHPCTWLPKRRFIPIDCSVTFDEASYPAFKTEEECQRVCDNLNIICRTI